MICDDKILPKLFFFKKKLSFFLLKFLFSKFQKRAPARVFQFAREVEIADITKNSAVSRTAINGD